MNIGPFLARTCLIIGVLAVLFSSIACRASHEFSTTSSKDTGPEFWAVAIGVGEYKYLEINTQYADDDAKAIAKCLKQLWGSDHVEVILDSKAIKRNIRNVIYDWLAPREEGDDTVLIHLSAHGNHEYVRLYDSFTGFDGNDIGYSELAEWLGILDSHNIFITMDTCGSGAFADDLVKDGRVILTCGTEDEKCWQNDKYKHGVFSYYILEALIDLDRVDTNSDDEISIGELFSFVNLRVADEFREGQFPSCQHPHLTDNHEGELILFTIPPHHRKLSMPCIFG